jgi:hypothetical protein
MNIALLFNNFSSGETNPLLAARVDSQQYNMGAKVIENFLPLSGGGLRKRPGTWFNGYTRGNARARLIDFPLDAGGYCVIELSTGYVRFWKDDHTLLGAELEVPYTEEDLPAVKYAVAHGILCFVHRYYAPISITWDGTYFILALPIFTGIDFTAEDMRPGAVAFDSGRLWFASTNAYPNRIWGSRAPDSTTGQSRYTDFGGWNSDTAAAIASDAIVLDENDMYGSRLKWIVSSRMMLAGTDRATWSDTGEIPTPATFDMNIVEYAGSADIQGRVNKDGVIYVGRNGKSLRALIYNSTSEGSGYIDADISIGAAHIFTPGISEIAISDYPYPLLWIIMRDGTLATCSIDLRGGLIAYARHPMQGFVESVTVVPGQDGDETWFVIERDGKRCIEHIKIDEITGVDYAESHYVDSGVRIALEQPDTMIRGLTHLANKVVNIFADRNALVPALVTGDGIVTLGQLEEPAGLLHIGLPYTSKLIPNTLAMPANGTSIGKKRRIERALLRVYESMGGKIGYEESMMEDLAYMRFGEYIAGESPEPFTGDLEITISGNIDTQGHVIIMHDDPVPFNLLALVERVAVLEV